VLDSSSGKPAEGVQVVLFKGTSTPSGLTTSFQPIGNARYVTASAGIGRLLNFLNLGTLFTRHSLTNVDGRCTDLLPPRGEAGALEAGLYRIVFHTGAYFEKTGRKSLYPFVEVRYHDYATSPLKK
jgi:5-hydroxyisourate hydrolase-like protein (transthyretin family)